MSPVLRDSRKICYSICLCIFNLITFLEIETADLSMHKSKIHMLYKKLNIIRSENVLCLCFRFPVPFQVHVHNDRGNIPLICGECFGILTLCCEIWDRFLTGDRLVFHIFQPIINDVYNGD